MLELDDAAEFLRAAGPLLLPNEARDNLIFGIAGSIVSDPGRYPEARFWIVTDGDDPAAAAMRTPPFNLLLARPRDDGALAALAAGITGELPGIVGGRPEVDRFARLWSERHEVTPRIQRRHGVYALETVLPLPPASGEARTATQRDRRVYPNPDLGQIVGFQSRLYGATGIEASFDAYLSGARTASVSALLEARLLGSAPPANSGANVRLTIDSTLQQVAQAALGNQAGAVALLDPQTGAILALASYPRFDPNQLVLPDQATQADVDKAQAVYQALAARPDSPLLNRATQGRYPPGSVIKTLTGAAALDAGVLNGPEGQVTCPEQLQTENGAPPVVNAVKNLAARTGNPSDLRRVYAWSCNTAFAQIGLALGPDRFADYAARFGLRTADTVSVTADLRDIPADAGTIAGTLDFLRRPAALADTSFGQGQALVTPLDMAQMVAVIANDGRLMRPYLVQEARVGNLALYTAQTEVLRQAITSQTAQLMRSVMQTSVEIGYAKPVALPGVAIGAKTGTAEAPGGAPHAWFVAIAPLEKPRVAIAVIVEHGGEGSRGALPIARQVLAATLGVQP